MFFPASGSGEIWGAHKMTDEISVSHISIFTNLLKNTKAFRTAE
jgi:hypothetical protein